jgi:hypothetical protein
MSFKAMLHGTTSMFPELEALARAAVAQFEALPQDEKDAMTRRQMVSWRDAEMAIGNDADEAAYRAKLRGDTL